MKRNEYTPYILIIYIIIIILTFMIMGCSRTQYVGSKYLSCPSNDKTFFYKRMGVTPSKQFIKYGN